MAGVLGPAKGFKDSDKLQGAINYALWPCRFKPMFHNYNCWDVMDPKMFATTSPSSPAENTAQQQQQSPQRQGQLPPQADLQPTALTRAEKKVNASIIFSATVADHLMSVVKEYEDRPAELWQLLKKRFRPANMGNLKERFMLEFKLHALKMQEGQKVEEHLEELDDILGELADIDVEVEAERLMKIVLAGSPASWQSFATTFGMFMRQINPDFEFSQLGEYLRAEDLQRSASRAQSDEVAFCSAKWGSNNAGRNRLAYRPQGTQKISNKEFTARTEYKPDRNRPTGNCNFRRKPDQWEQDCRFKQKPEAKFQEMMKSEIKIGNLANVAEKSAEPDHEGAGDTASDYSSQLVEIEANCVELFGRFENTWMIDSGATHHVTGNRKLFSKLSPKETEVKLSIASGAKIPIKGMGTVILDDDIALKVLYVPGLHRNLLSVGRLTDAGHNVLFTSKYCYVLDKRDSTKVHMRGIRHHRRFGALYRLEKSLVGNERLPPDVLRVYLPSTTGNRLSYIN